MGLDSYAVACDSKNIETELAYWRKHNALQGWMENVWREQGNTGVFNGQALALNNKLLDRLEMDVLSDNLPETRGFFFGSDSRYDEHKKDITLEFIKKARFKLRKGYKIIYYCSW